MEEIYKKFKELKEKLGIKAFEDVMDYHYTLIRKIEDITKSRDSWRKKYEELRDEIRSKRL